MQHVIKHHRDAIREAFKNIRKHGIRARMNFSCCSSCGHYELGERKGYARFVFWNRQSEDSFRQGGRGWGRNKNEVTDTLYHSLYLQWEGELSDAELIVAELRAVGLNAQWRGTISDCIEVKPNFLTPNAEFLQKQVRELYDSAVRWQGASLSIYGNVSDVLDALERGDEDAETRADNLCGVLRREYYA